MSEGPPEGLSLRFLPVAQRRPQRFYHRAVLTRMHGARVEQQRVALDARDDGRLVGAQAAGERVGGAGGRHLVHLLRLGVTAFMTGTEALELHGAAVEAYLKGDHDRSSDIYFQQILPYLQFYLDYPEELLKSMLHARGVIDCPQVIAPPASARMTDVERREFDWILDRIGWRKTWPQIP